ncbi:MAG: exodeoxyribonuclease VII small subunit [Clostridia bacterium]|nr:exodeoxyribonuclease VII small subunit [Clostridia bacterium]
MSKDNLTFEESLIELESITKKLESDNLPLEEAIELFQKGLKLSKECSDMLKSAKQKIEKITDLEQTNDD